MNDIERAIEEIKEHRDLFYVTEISKDSCDIAISALEKQIPKKPLQQQLNVNKDLIGLCPVCKEMWVIKYKEYCANCGQKLDWGED